jgi:hypothetical protein
MNTNEPITNPAQEPSGDEDELKKSPWEQEPMEVIYESIIPAENPVILADLLDSIEQAIKNHVVLGAEAAKALAAWVVHTYVYREREAVAYVAIQSPEKRCGKTTLLAVLAALAENPLVTSNISLGALFRAIAEAGPTLLIDEADTYLARNSGMRGVLNCGNTKRTAYVLRLARKEERHEEEENQQPRKSALVRYSCWCPKVIAMIGRVPETLADRSIVVNMERKLVSEKCVPLAELDATTIKRQCVRWAADHEPEVREWRRINLEEVNDRASDTFEPLMVIAEIAGPKWATDLSNAAKKLCAHENTEPEAASLLLDIMAAFISHRTRRLFSKNLADALRGKSGWVTFDVESREAVSELSIAKTLRRYHIRPGTVRIGAEVGKGYKWEDVLGALEHYVAKSEIGRKITELKEMSNLADEAAKEQDKQKEREGKRLAKVVAGAAKIAGQEAANAFEVTLQRAKDEKAAEEMELEEKDFKQELGITEGKCASP